MKEPTSRPISSPIVRIPPSRTAILVGALVVALAAVACGGGHDDDPAPSSGSRSSRPPTSTAGGEDAQARLDGAAITLTQVADLDDLTGLAVRPDDSTLYVIEQIGRVRAVRDGTLVDEPVLDISDRVTCCGEQGLLGIAFSPAGDRLYLHYSNPDGDNQVDEYEVDGDTVDASTRREVITAEGLQANHNGGQLAFGPDGYLYIGLGDGGGAGDQGQGHAEGGNGQSLDSLLGKILRIDPTPSGDRPYTIPDDNPFADGGGRPEIFVYGLRNPWRFSFDQESGDLWIGDVGQNAWEEVDFLPAGEGAGANFGWNLREGTNEYRGSPPEGHVEPILDYANPDEGCTVIGGYVYRGTRIPDLDGAYLYTDYCDGTIHAVVQQGGAVVAERPIFNGPTTITAFGQDNDGELYVLTQDDGLLRVGPA
jgi:glucose/arabinose dehydrogenase